MNFDVNNFAYLYLSKVSNSGAIKRDADRLLRLIDMYRLDPSVYHELYAVLYTLHGKLEVAFADYHKATYPFDSYGIRGSSESYPQLISLFYSILSVLSPHRAAVGVLGGCQSSISELRRTIANLIEAI